MGQNNFHLSYSEDPIHASSHCTRCGNSAEVHLALLDEMPQRSGSLCLLCAEALIHDLQNQYALFGHASSHSNMARSSLAHTLPYHEDNEHGIVFWEGQSWSSDGPFAGA